MWRAASETSDRKGLMFKMETKLNCHIATVEQLHRVAQNKSLYSIRLTGEVKLQDRMYDTWIARYTDREDEVLYVSRT